MSQSRLFGLLMATTSLHRTLMDIGNSERAREKAGALDAYIPNAKASGVLGDARLADMDDVVAAKLLDPKGLFIGSFEGRMLFYPGGEPGLTILRTGGGKGRDLVLPNLAHNTELSFIVGDGKEGENAFASFDHRAKTLGIPCIAIDPYEISGKGNICINPMQILLDIVARGERLDDQADDIAQSIIPVDYKNKNAWPEEGARELIATVLEYYAYCVPAECRPGGLFNFFNQSPESFERMFTMMKTCGYENIARGAEAYYGIWKDAKKQFAAYISAANAVLRPFAPGKPLDKATSRHDFDVTKLKRSPHTIYLILPSRKTTTAGTWMSMMVSYLIEAIAEAPGSVRTCMILDEFAQMPPTPAIPKAIRLYREKGIQPWLIIQSRESLKDKWSDDAIREFESQAGFLTMKYISDPGLMRDVSYWSGTRSVVMHGHNHGGGKLETASASISETKRPVLQAEDILNLGEKQIVKIASMPRLLVCDTVPWFTVNPWSGQLNDPRQLHHGKK